MEASNLNRSFQTYSPRTRPLYYDALANDTGCQDITGNRVDDILPFSQICIFEHSNNPLSVFNKPDQISYTTGPSTTGLPMPWVTRWAAWVATAGIRAGKFSHIDLPSDNLGDPSNLFRTIDTPKVSIDFTPDAWMALAVQLTPSSIQVKWFKDGTGLDVGSATFLGVSPALFNTGKVRISEDAGETDLALYYIRPETPRNIYARLLSEEFATEHLIHENIQARLASLMDSGFASRKHILWARDIFGRDITFSSAPYAIEVDDDKANWEIGFESGSYDETAVLSDAGTDEAIFTIGIESGSYDDIIQEPASVLSDDKATLTIGFHSGEYST